MGFCLSVQWGVAQIPQSNHHSIYKGNFLFLPESGPALALTGNPGLLGLNSVSLIGLQSERRFLLDELSFHQFILVFPAGQASWAGSVHYFGSTNYNESSATVSYGRKLGKLCLGVQFDYQFTKAMTYESQSRLGARLGVVWSLADRLLTGIELRNPIHRKENGIDSKLLPFEMNWFLNLLLSDQAGLGIRVEKGAQLPAVISVAILYQPVQSVRCRTGILTTGFSPWLSVEFQFKQLYLTIQTTYHTQLGVTPGMSLVYQLTKKNP